MNEPIPVQIARPQRKRGDSIAQILATVVLYLINGWIVMQLAPVVIHGADIGYGRAIALVILIRALTSTLPEYTSWTVPFPKRSKP